MVPHSTAEGEEESEEAQSSSGSRGDRVGQGALAFMRSDAHCMTLDPLLLDWTTAADALKALEEQHNLQLKKLNVPALQALVRCLKLGNGTGKKDDLIEALTSRFGSASHQEFDRVRATIERGAPAMALPPPIQLQQPALPAPAPTAIVPAPAAVITVPLALTRPRRGAAN
eukprot:CAMPEP_0115868806 /NCGR_PEP_ID=MMETSP0287-20121206/21483_1 /TAXON_ID=412157 /ORGANISM="Chrysochromulina rotalis, Strain UIO044" /LENGTH=170 /DNA_ID=CAMNT_0003323473 /DNA_START=285 /DNA_END=799 /DNA_ORIENTATION=-